VRTINKVLMKLFQKFPGLDGVQGLELALMGHIPTTKKCIFANGF